MKLCLFCTHFYFYPGEYGYSDMTPGYDAEMGCTESIIKIDLMEDSLDDYRTKILTASKCKKFNKMEVKGE